MYWNKCPYCGANLDPCEKCDCERSRKRDSPKPHENADNRSGKRKDEVGAA